MEVPSGLASQKVFCGVDMTGTMQVYGGAAFMGKGVTAVFDGCIFSANGVAACEATQNTQVLFFTF